MQGNVLGQSGSNAGLNIFTQPNEPSGKNGIWIKTETQYKYEKVQFIENMELVSGKYTKLKACPVRFDFSVSVNTNIYLLNDDNKNYKYDILTGTYTKLKDIPADGGIRQIASVGTDIYLLGNSSDYYDYKYDTLTDTYTKLTVSPVYFDGSATTVETDIYLLGGTSNRQSYKYNYKYDTMNNTYTKLTDIPYNFYKGSAIAVGTNIYLFGGADDFESNAYNYTYKYNILTDAYEKLTDIPYEYCCGSIVAVETNIYLLGGSYAPNLLATKGYKYNYKFDTMNNTYTKLTDIPYNFYKGSATTVITDIYLFGGANYGTNAYVYRNTNTTNKSVVVEIQDCINKIILSKILEAYFSDAKIYDSNALQEYPLYYGNGEEWIEI